MQGINFIVEGQLSEIIHIVKYVYFVMDVCFLKFSDFRELELSTTQRYC